MCAEVHENVIHFTQLACKDLAADLVDLGVEAVDHADVQDLTRFLLCLLHFKRLGIDAGSRLFAQNVLACAECVHGDDLVHQVRGADADCVHLGIVDDVVVVLNCDTALVVLHSLVRPLLDDIAEILDLRIGAVHIRRDVRCVCDRTAADHTDFYFCHNLLYSLWNKKLNKFNRAIGWREDCRFSLDV